MAYYVNEIISLLNIARHTVSEILVKEIIKEEYSFKTKESIEKQTYCTLIINLHDYLHEYITYNEVLYDNNVRHVVTVLTNLLNRYQINYNIPTKEQRQLHVEADLEELYPKIIPGNYGITVFKSPSMKLIPTIDENDIKLNLFRYSEGASIFNFKFEEVRGYYEVDGIVPNKSFLGPITEYSIKAPDIDIKTLVNSDVELIELNNIPINSHIFTIETTMKIGEGEYPVTNLGEPSKYYINSNGIKTDLPFPAIQSEINVYNKFYIEMTEAILANIDSLLFFSALPLQSTKEGSEIQFTLVPENIYDVKRHQIAIPQIIHENQIYTIYMFSSLTNSFIDASNLFTNDGLSIINGSNYYTFTYNQAKHGETLIKIQF